MKNLKDILVILATISAILIGFSYYVPEDRMSFYYPTSSVEITKHFGNIYHANEEKWMFHSGIDFVMGDEDDHVVSAGWGVVSFSGWKNAEYGYRIEIQHLNNILTTYSHLNKIEVQKNEPVRMGQIIASGGSKKDKLHFEIIQQGNPINPLHYLP